MYFTANHRPASLTVSFTRGTQYEEEEGEEGTRRLRKDGRKKDISKEGKRELRKSRKWRKCEKKESGVVIKGEGKRKK